MTTATQTNQPTDLPGKILPGNQPAADTWDAGGQAYEKISLQISDAIEHCVDRLAPQPDESILDVATGTGIAARLAAARGAKVTGTDIGAELIEAARHLDESKQIDFQVGDADALPFEDAQFDAVISTFGVMFSSNPQKAADELARVTRPGGRIALAVWQDQGGVFEMFKCVQSHQPNPNPNKPSPFRWADREQVEAWLGDHFELAVEPGISQYRETSASNAWDTFRNGFGPVKALFEKLEGQAAENLRQDFEAMHNRYRTELGILVTRPYLIIAGTRKS